ncbi:hypothetical protein MJD09_25300 [bacterium]|nr:hypothetical protein [bacterium]
MARHIAFFLVLSTPILAQLQDMMGRDLGSLAEVVRAADGVNLLVDAHVWLRLTARASVQPSRVDTVELTGKYEDEKDLARQTKSFVERRVGKTHNSRRISPFTESVEPAGNQKW